MSTLFISYHRITEIKQLLTKMLASVYSILPVIWGVKISFIWKMKKFEFFAIVFRRIYTSIYPVCMNIFKIKSILKT